MFEFFCMIETCFRFELMILKAEDHLYNRFTPNAPHRTSSQLEEVPAPETLDVVVVINNTNNIELRSLVESIDPDEQNPRVAALGRFYLGPDEATEYSSQDLTRAMSEPAASRNNLRNKSFENKSFIL